MIANGCFDRFLPRLPGYVRALVFGLLPASLQAAFWGCLRARVERDRAEERA